MKHCHQITFLAGLCLLWNNYCVAADPGVPTPNVSELKQLDLFSGEWAATLGNTTEKITSERSWVLDGYFLKHTFEASGGALRGIIYRGYNQKEQRYTMTFLDSKGNASLLTGDWNADLKMFIFEAVHTSCEVQKYESYFPDENTEQWTITFDNVNRNQITGVATKISK